MRLSHIFFLVTIALIPIQLGKFFFLPESYVLGIPIDYLAVNIYLVDFALVLYLAAFTIENLKNRKTFKKFTNYYKAKKIFILSWFLLVLYLLFDSALASQRSLSYAFFLRFFIVSLFGVCASFTLQNRKLFVIAIATIGFSSVWQSAVILGQFILQKSLNLWILGERSFDATTVNIAHVELFGRQFLRPYGTFPHPNVAAAFLVISLLITRQSKYLSALLFLSIVSTYSKSAISIVILYLLTQGKIFFRIITVFLIALAVVFLLKTFPASQIASVSERLVLIQAALDISLKNPLFGVGSANFISQLAYLNLTSAGEIRLLQPVHNVFLLVLSENGIFGLVLFAFLLLTVLKKATSFDKILLFTSLLIFASFDHFLWTLNQGRLLFWLTLAFIISSQENK